MDIAVVAIGFFCAGLSCGIWWRTVAQAKARAGWVLSQEKTDRTLRESREENYRLQALASDMKMELHHLLGPASLSSPANRQYPPGMANAIKANEIAQMYQQGLVSAATVRKGIGQIGGPLPGLPIEADDPVFQDFAEPKPTPDPDDGPVSIFD